MWAQRADAWACSADLPQHVKSVALLAGAHCPKDQALGNSGEPEENYQLWPNAEVEEEASATNERRNQKSLLKYSNLLRLLRYNQNWIDNFFVVCVQAKI
jgi:hypothetical protein